MRRAARIVRRIALMKRRAVSSVGIATAVSIIFSLGIWVALGVFLPGQAGFGSGGAGTGRGPILIGAGVFALTMFAWSKLHGKKDEDL